MKEKYNSSDYIRLVDCIAFYGQTASCPELSKASIKNPRFFRSLEDIRLLELALVPFDKKRDAVIEIRQSIIPHAEPEETSVNVAGLVTDFRFFFGDGQLWARAKYEAANGKERKILDCFRKAIKNEEDYLTEIRGFVTDSEGLLVKYALLFPEIFS